MGTPRARRGLVSKSKREGSCRKLHVTMCGPLGFLLVCIPAGNQVMHRQHGAARAWGHRRRKVRAPAWMHACINIYTYTHIYMHSPIYTVPRALQGQIRG